jgi:hypothetical protein
LIYLYLKKILLNIIMFCESPIKVDTSFLNQIDVDVPPQYQLLKHKLNSYKLFYILNYNYLDDAQKQELLNKINILEKINSK